MTTRTDLYHLIDELPEGELPAAQRLLEGLCSEKHDSLLLALLQAPWDDELETEEERTAVREAKQDRAAGRVVSHDEARRRLLGHP